MKKALSIILALLLCLPILASCKDTTQSEAPDTSTTTNATVAEGSPDTTTAATESVNTEPALNFGGKTFTLLHWDDGYPHEYFVEEQTGDLIADSVFLRNALVEERLGVEIEWVATHGQWEYQEQFVTNVATDIQSGGEYDAFSTYSLTMATIAMRGFARDLMELEHFEFEQPWWASSLIELSTVNGCLYFCGGDISVSMLREMNCTIFNKTIAEELKLGNLYELVDNGVWTIDKMAELASTAYIDLNGNSTQDMNDQYGIGLLANWCFDPFYAAAGLLTVEKDENDALIISPDFSSERTQLLVEKLVSVFHHTDYTAFPKKYPEWTNRPFAEGRVLFIIDSNSVTSLGDFADSTVVYGILPVPKLEEEQEGYHTLVQLAHSMYSISSATNDADANMASAVLEYLAAESYKSVTPAAFETTMKLKHASGNDDARMYDLLRETVFFDFGHIYSAPLANIPIFAFRDIVYNGNTNWASLCKAEIKRMQKLLEQIQSAFDAN